LRIVNWNIDKGGRAHMEDKIVDFLFVIEPDVIVLPEFRKDKPHIMDKLLLSGFQPHIPDAEYKTGNQVAIFTKTELGFETLKSINITQLDGLTIFCNNDFWTIGGVFFPEKEKNSASIYPFFKWINEDPFKLSEHPIVLTGDFNYGVQAAFWNKGKTGNEYNRLQKLIGKSFLVDCCLKPDPNRKYLRTYCRNQTALPDTGQKWAKGSSRPDHFFVSEFVSFEKISVSSVHIRKGISDHESMLGDFSLIQNAS